MACTYLHYWRWVKKKATSIRQLWFTNPDTDCEPRIILIVTSTFKQYAEKTDTTLILVSDKTWFHLDEYMNS